MKPLWPANPDLAQPACVDTTPADEAPPRPTKAARPVKAVGIVSGGLDSTLAIRTLKEQGIEVRAINFYTGFCTAEVNRRVGGKHSLKEVATNAALEAGAQTEQEIEMVDISQEYIKMALQPEHGYGKNMNPCIDCRIMMLQKAKAIMEEEGADFVFTGEVLGQRPMSQHRQSLDTIERASGLTGKLLRPLSAAYLPQTQAEAEGLVDREALPKISGRSRKVQMTLAREYGIDHYPTPSGGCCQLTDENFALKFRDLIEQRKREAGGDLSKVEISPDDTVLLGVGRHFRLGPSTKLIVGRDEDENRLLDIYANRMSDRFLRLAAQEHVGPVSLLEGPTTDALLDVAASIVGRYCDGRGQPRVAIELRRGEANAPSAQPRLLAITPITDEGLLPYRLV